MNTFQSRSSSSVKIVTVGFILTLIIVSFGLIFINKDYGWMGSIILGAIIIAVVLYFYAKALDKIIVEKEGVVLKTNVGQIYIPKSELIGVEKLGSSSLTMTYGSNGVFGFIGNTMDDSISFVRDKKHMLKITTISKKYILSSERSDELIASIRKTYNLK